MNFAFDAISHAVLTNTTFSRKPFEFWEFSLIDDISDKIFLESTNLMTQR